MNAQIQIKCSAEFKRAVKEEILKRGIDSFHQGYEEIFALGMEEFLKKNKKGEKKK